MRTLSQLAPGEHVIITYKLTAPETYEAEDLAMMTINITAEILETGQSWTDSLTFYVVGIDPGLPIWIWIIIIVGSAAAATTSFVFIRKRRVAPSGPRKKLKPKDVASITQAIATDFPGTYTVLSTELIERVNSLIDLTDEERELLFQYLSQLDEDAALQFLDQLQGIDLN